MENIVVRVFVELAPKVQLEGRGVCRHQMLLRPRRILPQPLAAMKHGEDPRLLIQGTGRLHRGQQQLLNDRAIDGLIRVVANGATMKNRVTDICTD